MEKDTYLFIMIRSLSLIVT